MTTSYKVSDNLFLVHNQTKTNATAPAKKVEEPTNHVLVIDCSGSMYSELPKIRQQCKTKLPKLLKENDTVSVIWFSGRGEFGALLEGEKVAGLTDLQSLNGAIDRWLKPVGLTGFKEPIVETKALVERVSKKNPGAFSLFFMSDGCDNQWSRADIVKAVEDTAPSLQAATFVEYGYYADRPLLTQMAEKAGGQLIFSQDFDRYDAIFTETVSKRAAGGAKVAHKLPNADYIGGIAFEMRDGDLVTYAINNGEVAIPTSTTDLWFLSPSAVGQTDAFDMTTTSKNSWNTTTQPASLSAAYAAISLWAVRMKPEVVKPLLRSTGDVGFIEQFANCFGKQAYSDFMDAAKAAAFDPSKRYANGWDPNKVPRDDAFTVLQMLEMLSEDDENRIIFDHEKFSYSRIGRGRVDANTVLTEAEQEEIANLQAQLTTTKDPKEVAKISARITEISDKPEALKFVEDAAKAAQGYSISNLTLNEDRPNVSVLVRKEGTVDLSGRKDRPKTVPEVIHTHIFRNYTIIKDGLVNVQTLPMRISDATKSKFWRLEKNGDIPAGTLEFDGSVALVNFGKLPVINTQMVKSVSAVALAKKQYEMLQYKGAQKVYNSYYKDEFPGETKGDGWKKTFGDDGVEWLKAQGLTESNGFAPKSVQAEATDFYMGKELSVKLKGLSSLPTLKDVKAKLDGKLTASAQLMAPSVRETEKVLAEKKGDDLKKWLDSKKTDATSKARKAMFEMAQAKFGVIVGQTWFSEFGSLDENTLDVKMDDGTVIPTTFEMGEFEVKV